MKKHKECKFCNKLIHVFGLVMHERYCLDNHERIEKETFFRECTNCHKDFVLKDKSDKFCSISCAASFNNSNRVHKEETKEKISLTLKKSIPVETEELCHRGCGKQAKYITRSKKFVCEEYSTTCDAVKYKNSCGVKTAYLEGRKYNDYNNGLSLEDRKRGSDTYKRNREEQFKNSTFEELTSKTHRIKRICEEQNNQCGECSISKWNNKRIVLELHHIDGNNSNNTRSNLICLCPNCHSQTSTWRRRKSSLGLTLIQSEASISL